MAVLSNLFEHLQNRFFHSVISDRLVYNTCWEDPRIDRQLLHIKSGSEVVMLTSAGCNALDYLLDTPSSIHCVDANPSQNALLELKKTLFQYGQYKMLWNLFGTGSDEQATLLYKENLSQYLSHGARLFWDRHINYFSPGMTESSFYFHGTSGKIALMIQNRIKHKGLYGKTLRLLNSASPEEQTHYFEDIAPHLWSAFYKWLIKRNATMAMLGVPASQRDMIEQECEGGLFAFIQSSLEHVFTRLSLKDNYFWRVYLTGSYTPACCPNYLKKEHFDFFRKHISRIHQHTCPLTEFLKKNPGSYTHFILLDHQDWLANTRPELLREEWYYILQNARPGAQILFRSAGTTHCFLPDFVHDYVCFDSESTSRLHGQDRVGTYGRTFLGKVCA